MTSTHKLTKIHVPGNVTNTFTATITSICKLTKMHVSVNITNSYITTMISTCKLTKMHVLKRNQHIYNNNEFDTQTYENVYTVNVNNIFLSTITSTHNIQKCMYQ